MKRAILILLIFFVANSTLADTSALPTYEQAQKLAAAAWKYPPRSFDITFFSEVTDNTQTEEKIRRILKEHFDNEYGPDEELSPEQLERKEREIQLNVDSNLIEKQSRKNRFRVRSDGSNYLIDRVSARPDKVLLKETPYEEFRPGREIDANTPFETTYIEVKIPNNGTELYTFSHDSKNARAEKMKASPTTFIKSQVNSIINAPETILTFLQMKLGTKRKNSELTNFDINEPKIRQLCDGTLEGINVEIKPDINEPDAKDRIEIGIYRINEISINYKSFMISDKNDYSKVYYYELSTSDANKQPVLTTTLSDYDAQGIPHNVTKVQYDTNGKIQLHETYKIENVRLNIQIPKEVFEFNPPEGYVVRDLRLPEDQRQKLRIESMKKLLKNEESSGRRISTFLSLSELLKDDPAQLKEIAEFLQNDKDSNIQRIATVILRRIESEKKQQ